MSSGKSLSKQTTMTRTKPRATQAPLISGLYKSKCKAKTHCISSKGVHNNQNRLMAIINNSKVSEFPHNKNSSLAGWCPCCNAVQGWCSAPQSFKTHTCPKHLPLLAGKQREGAWGSMYRFSLWPSHKLEVG